MRVRAWVVLALAGACLAAIGCASALLDAPSPAAPPSDHFDGARFFDPDRRVEAKAWEDLLRFWTSGKRAAWPDHIENTPYPPPPERVGPGELSVTFVGHATFLVQMDGINLLTDPVFGERAGPFGVAGPKRVRAPGVALDALPPIDAVVISHNHYDHMDLGTLRALEARSHPLVVVGLGNAATLRAAGLSRVEERDWWQESAAGGATITFVPAQHWSRRGPFDRNHTLWGGFVVRTASASIYFAGDTGYPAAFRAVRERLGPPDLALLPIGGYEPRWFMQPQHLDPDEAVAAHRELGARLSLGMHFGTFQLSDEPVDAPVAELAAARRRNGLDASAIRTLDFGETLTVKLRRELAAPHPPDRGGE